MISVGRSYQNFRNRIKYSQNDGGKKEYEAGNSEKCEDRQGNAENLRAHCGGDKRRDLRGGKKYEKAAG